MKAYIYILLVLFGFFSVGCEDVIDVDLDTAPPRLVIDASIQWKKNTTGNEQQIKLTTTTGYFDENIPTVSGAVISVIDDDNQSYEFIEDINQPGIYLCDHFMPVLEKNYILTVVLNGETYIATETLKSVTPITRIEESKTGGFGGTDIEIKTFFNDPADQTNYYLFNYKSNNSPLPTFEVSDDRFYQGNEFFGYYSNEELAKDDTIDITLYGISKRYSEYMLKLINLAGYNNGSPFSTPPATLRGNIINQTNSKNYALGYFSLSETDFTSYTVISD